MIYPGSSRILIGTSPRWLTKFACLTLQNNALLCCSMLDRPWGSLSGNLSSDIYEICGTKGLLFVEQRSTMASKIWLLVCVGCVWWWLGELVNHTPRPSNLKHNLITANSLLCASKAIITKFYTVVKSPQNPALASVYIVKSSVTSNKRYIQTLIEMRLNPHITHQGFWEGPNPKQKCRLALLCGFENWTFYVIQLFRRT